MPTSIRELAVAALVTRLGTISTGNGYETNAGSNIYVWRGIQIPQANLPAIILRDTLRSVELTVQRDIVTLEVVCECLVAASAAATALRSVEADLFRALKTDLTLGGLVEDIKFGEETFMVEHDEVKMAGAEVSLEVTYTTNHFDPDA